MNGEPDLQSRLDAMLSAEAHPEKPFSPFFGGGASLAGELATELRRVAQTEDLRAALSHAEKAALAMPAGAVKWALKIFVTHEPLARGELTLPAVEALKTEPIEGEPPRGRPPGLPPGIPGLPPGNREHGEPERLDAAPPPDDRPDDWDAQAEPSLTEPPEERSLDWYREDPFANDHHSHWHSVYPRSGRGPDRLQRRHGELFFYMHEQMLARYDTERVIAGIDRVKPHPPPEPNGRPDYATPIAEGYGSEGYTLRSPSRSFSEVPGAVENLSAWHASLESAIDAGHLRLADGSELGPLEESLLGSATESAAFNAGEELIEGERIGATYGNLHGSGHGYAAGLGAGPDPLGWGGAIGWLETAICDPLFYRWHKHVDDVKALFRERTGETNDPAAFAVEGVAFGDERSIALALSRDIPGASDESFDFDGFAAGEFGPGFGDQPPLTDRLLTRFVRSRVSAGVPGGDRVAYSTTHLTHEPFTYFVRLENRGAQPREVTLRTFLAHADLAEDRKAWIELDKFETTLRPGFNVLARPDARSSVIKRRGVSAPGAEQLAADAEDRWCDCGWPYTLLLPSGASDEDGTPFKLVVAVTDAAADREPDHVRTCGSMSYCGALENYPDRRRMGYPFDRPFAGQSIAEAIAASASMASIDLTIRCETARPPE